MSRARQPATNIFHPAWLLFCLAYVITGKLGLTLVLPPGYASAVFPPAGIAIAGAFIAGRNALPWTFVGSLALNLLVGLGAAPGMGATARLSAIAIAIASTTQAWVGGALLGRHLGYPTTLGSARELAVFYTLGPASCVVSSTLSIACLAALGVIPPDGVAMSWLAWWIGDTTGLLLMVPAMLALFGQPRPLWRSRIRDVALPMFAAFALAVSVFVVINGWEQDEQLQDYRAQSRQVQNELWLRFELYESLLDQAEALFSMPQHGHDPVPTRNEFAHFVGRSLDRFQAIRAIEWAPRVLESERAEFEKGQASEHTGFEIRERAPGGAMVPAASRAVYHPVTYIEPLLSNELAVGYDLAWDPARREALLQASTRQGLVATAPLQLVQEMPDQTGVLLIRSIKGGTRRGDAVLAVLRFSAEMEALTESTRENLHVRLLDVEALQVLYDSFPGPQVTALSKVRCELGNREYDLETAPTSAYLKAHRGWESWTVLVVSLLGTGLLGAVLLLGTGQRAHAEELVEKRTRRLREHEARLAISEQRFRDMAMSSGDVIWETDTEGRFTYCVGETTRLFGLEADELLGRRRTELLGPDEARRVEEHLEGLAHENAPLVDLETWVLAHDDSPRCVLSNGVPVYARDGSWMGYRGVDKDISERKEAERELKRAMARAESASAAKSAFLSNISHQMRTPLHQISGMAELLPHDPLTSRQARWLDVLDQAASRLTRSVESLLHLTHIESGELVLAEGPLLLDDLLSRVASGCRRQAEAKGLLFRVEPTRVQMLLLGDDAKLRMALSHYIDNAIKFTHVGSVTVRAVVQDDDGAPLVRFEVEDTGPGIPAEGMPGLFDIFERLDSSHDPDHGAAGLGLVTVRRIAAQMGGDSGCSSAPGTGSTFWFTARLALANPKASATWTAVS